MNSSSVLEWLPSQLDPFFTLQYPTERPAEPDSFPSASYYTLGIRDACLIVSCITAMAALRDATRLLILEPFAQWCITRNLSYAYDGEAVTSPSTGDKASFESLRKARSEERRIKRSVVRFAEQGWSLIYYSLQWSFGLVSPWSKSFSLCKLKCAFNAVHSLQSPDCSVSVDESVAELSAHPSCGAPEVLLLNSNGILHSSDAHPERRGAP